MRKTLLEDKQNDVFHASAQKPCPSLLQRIVVLRSYHLQNDEVPQLAPELWVQVTSQIGQDKSFLMNDVTIHRKNLINLHLCRQILNLSRHSRAFRIHSCSTACFATACVHPASILSVSRQMSRYPHEDTAHKGQREELPGRFGRRPAFLWDRVLW